MATLPKDFIGKDALQHVAEQVSKEILMGPGYTDAEEMDRLGIDIVSGVQFKRTFHILLRKGGTTRRKDVRTKVNSEAGFLKERTLTVKLSWDHYTDNIDKYCETIFGTDAQGQYPLSTTATEAILRNYADNLTACLWHGDIDLDKGGENVPAQDQAMALYDGFHTCIKHDIEDGIISEANGNLIPCEAITAPADNNDSTPYDNFLAWHMKWDARLRKANTRVYMSELTAQYIAAGYANKFHGNFKVDYEPGGNFKLPGLSRVTICPVADFGEGDRMYTTIDKNFVYGVDTESNQTYVGVRVSTDNDMRDIQFQIQSIQGAGIKNPFKYAFCMSDGSLASAELVAGDYTNSNLVVTLAKANAQDAGNIDGTVKVNGTAYKDPIETSVNQIISLEATDGTNYKFVNWSNGSTEKKIQLTATGMSMGLTAFFKKNG
nr:MAG TPA: hypothetical protein [Caudoviricetes sp.]